MPVYTRITSGRSPYMPNLIVTAMILAFSEFSQPKSSGAGTRPGHSNRSGPELRGLGGPSTEEGERACPLSGGSGFQAFSEPRERGKFPQETDIKRVRGGQKYMRCDAMMRRRDVPRARRAGGLLLLCRDLEMGPDLGLFMLSLSLSLSPSLRRQRAPRPCLGRHRTRA